MEAHVILNRIYLTLTRILQLGFVNPSVQFDIRPREAKPYRAYVYHEPSPGAYNKYEFFDGETPVEALDALALWVSDQPTPEERAMTTYFGLVAKAVELGKAKGFDTAVVNPLEEVMKRLSDNAITYVPAAEPDDDGIPF